MNIVVVVGGTNEPSNADHLADAFINGVHDVDGAQTEKIRLRDLHIDHFEMKYYEATTDQGEDFRRIQKAILSADGVVFATPIWNFSIPAHLKNLIDRMGSFGLDAESRSLGQLKGKPFFLLYTGGTPMTAWPLQRGTTSHVPIAIRYFGGTVIGKHYEPRCTLGKGKFGLVVDDRPESLTKVRTRGKAFAQVCKTYTETGKLPMREVILKKLAEWGQQVKKALGI